ncbi:cbb3-type cytochrome c oxidase subunit 3 [Marinimicrobium sp. ABcell2]|uniref:cbb3-type cytochrome oxidase subunit 3 n=1 Tax=Marinimicrobium sp. ABcell2 TaxID=3069751 RepID=UPI0027B63E3E|nr:cbb3-type cytochrome c oxidase subunit 3 [Marinimicrobium sp. ABcell2]MDQ2078454.1 cbb3-type cytochrome c oxidase subunit 3 [Marinimicrobium sp. ABcell2]
MDSGLLGTISTLLMAAAFAAICWWAFSPRRKKRFEDAAEVPFKKDENDPETPSEDDDSDTPADRDQAEQNDSSRQDKQ